MTDREGAVEGGRLVRRPDGIADHIIQALSERQNEMDELGGWKGIDKPVLRQMKLRFQGRPGRGGRGGGCCEGKISVCILEGGETIGYDKL